MLGFFIFIETLFMDSKSALAELKSFQGSRKGANQYFDQYQGELGVGATKERADSVRGLIRNTETALKGVGEAVSGRTRGQLVTEAQRSRLANLEREPLASELSDYQGDYSEEMQNYRDLLGQAGTRSQLAYQTDTDRQNSLQTIYDRLFQEEQAAEAKRQWEAQQAEARRQFDAQMSARQREAQQSLARVASLLGNTGAAAGASKAPSSTAGAFNQYQDQAFKSAYSPGKQSYNPVPFLQAAGGEIAGRAKRDAGNAVNLAKQYFKWATPW